MTAVYQATVADIALAQMGQVDEGHAAKQEHQQEIGQYTLLRHGQLRIRVRIVQTLHLASRKRALGAGNHLGINSVEKPGIVAGAARGSPAIVDGTKRA